MQVGAGLMRTQPQPIELYKRGENTGTILVQLVIHLENCPSPAQSLAGTANSLNRVGLALTRCLSAEGPTSPWLTQRSLCRL